MYIHTALLIIKQYLILVENWQKVYSITLQQCGSMDGGWTASKQKTKEKPKSQLEVVTLKQ